LSSKLWSAVAVVVCAFAVVPWTNDGSKRAKVCFTPGDDCTRFITQQIAKARSELLVQAYQFTLMPIVDAICEAKDRQVAVKVLLDRSNKKDKEPYAATVARLEQCAEVLVDHGVQKAHNKILVIDRTHVITGSFNLTTSAATRNAVNVVLIPDDPEVAEAFAGNFFKRAKAPAPLKERPPRDADVSMSGAPTGATASP